MPISLLACKEDVIPAISFCILVAYLLRWVFIVNCYTPFHITGAYIHGEAQEFARASVECSSFVTVRRSDPYSLVAGMLEVLVEIMFELIATSTTSAFCIGNQNIKLTGDSQLFCVLRPVMSA